MLLRFFSKIFIISLCSFAAQAETITIVGVPTLVSEDRLNIPSLGPTNDGELPKTLLIASVTTIDVPESPNFVDPSNPNGTDIFYGGKAIWHLQIFDANANKIFAWSNTDSDWGAMRGFYYDQLAFENQCRVNPPYDEAVCNELTIEASQGVFEGSIFSEDGVQFRVYGADLFEFSGGYPLSFPDFPEFLDSRISRSMILIGRSKLDTSTGNNVGRALYEFQPIEFCSKDLGASAYAACLNRIKAGVKNAGYTGKAIGTLQSELAWPKE